MNGPLVERLIRAHVLPRMPGFTVTKRLLHVAPVCDILRGYYFESSGFDANLVWVEAFVQPLYVPSDCLVLSRGGRLGCLRGEPEEKWDTREVLPAVAFGQMADRIVVEGEQTLGGLDAPAALLRWLLAPPQAGFDDRATLEAVAYTHARLVVAAY